MLTPDQVIPFLQHEDSLVRRQAVAYFRDCSGPGPLVADAFWDAIDRFGKTDELPALAGGLVGLPHTEKLLRRLLGAIGGVSRLDDHYQEAIRHIELRLLVEHRDLLLGNEHLEPEVAAHLRRRLELAEQPSSVAWDELMALAKAEVGHDADEPTLDEVDALAEAAARDAEAVASAAALLADPTIQNDWREVYAAQVVGEARPVRRSCSRCCRRPSPRRRSSPVQRPSRPLRTTRWSCRGRT